MIAKIDNARYEVAAMWEDRLMDAMGRLKIELESCYAEDRAEALQIAHTEKIEEIACLTNKFSQKENELRDEVGTSCNHKWHSEKLINFAFRLLN